MRSGYIEISDEIIIDVNIVTIVLGADESLLQIDKVDGFSFEKVSLKDFKYRDRILMANQKLNNKYYMSQLQNDLNDIQNSSFICLKKTSSFKITSPKIDNEIILSENLLELPELQEYKEAQFELINRIISKLMILKVADIGIYEVFYEFSWKFIIMNNTYECTDIISDTNTIINKKYCIGIEEANVFTDYLSKHNKAYELIKLVIDNYTYSFKLLESAKSFEQLITGLEIMFLSSRQKNKKEALAKRMSVLLGDDDIKILKIYNRIKSFYKSRSESTHEGINTSIGEVELLELKELTRLSIIKYIEAVEVDMSLNINTSFHAVKSKLISSLKNKVLNKITEGVLPQ